MEKVHVRGLNAVCNAELDATSSFEKEFLDNIIDDAQTFITNVEEARNNMPSAKAPEFGDYDFGGDDIDPFDPDTSKYDPIEPTGIDSDYIENNKKIGQIMGRLNARDSDTLDEFEEEKCLLLEKIDSMLEIIQDAGIKLKDIPTVSEKDSLSTIQAVHKRIKRKYDTMNYSETGGHIILGATQAVENIFNGRRSLFGYRPDLTGFSDRYVRAKLPSLKKEAAQLVADKIESCGFSEITNILIQLIPGAIFHATTRRHTNNVRDGDYVDSLQKLSGDD